MNEPAYNRIGAGYARTRRAEPSIVAEVERLLALLGKARIIDVGAGTGTYARALADRGYELVAVEPSPTMRAQAEPHERVRWIDAEAEALPLEDASVDGAICILALHHFADPARAAAEMVRVSRTSPIVVLTFDPSHLAAFWLCGYFPHLLRDADRFPPVGRVAAMFAQAAGRPARVVRYPVPRDCQDLFAAAAWARPELYLDGGVRAGMSPFALAPQDEITSGLERLHRDVASGDWDKRYRALRSAPAYDIGYRFIVVAA